MLGRGASVIIDRGKDTDVEGNLLMPMSTRLSGRIYLM
jgi:hypothetical protein